jgi:hypothetical protein
LYVFALQGSLQSKKLPNLPRVGSRGDASSAAATYYITRCAAAVIVCFAKPPAANKALKHVWVDADSQSRWLQAAQQENQGLNQGTMQATQNRVMC